MRHLDDEEQALLTQLVAGPPTSALLTMLRDPAEILDNESLAVRARVVVAAAERLKRLTTRPSN